MTEDARMKMAVLIKAAKEQQASAGWRELIATMASEKFAKFQAYRAAGFDAKQALELVIREQVQ